MVVLMEEISGGGKKRRQCNARCHDAKRPKCRCICGGKYHGSARDGTLLQHVDQIIKEFGAQAEAAIRDAAQLPLGIQ